MLKTTEIKKRLLSLLLCIVMLAGMLPVTALAAGGDTAPPSTTKVSANTPTALDNWTGVTADGDVFGGWLASDGMHYKGGETVNFASDTELTAAYGHVEVEKSLGEADTTAKGNTLRNDYAVTSTGAVDPATIGRALDFSGVTVNGASVGSNVTKIEFANVAALPEYDIMPSADDPYRAVIADDDAAYDDVLYAREVGEGENNQVLAVLRGESTSGYTITVYGVGGVSAPVDSMGLFYNHEKRWDRLAQIDFTNFDTSNAVSMQNFLMECSALNSVDFSGFDTSNVVTMQGMLQNCAALTDVDASPLKTGNVQSMRQMFYGCTHLETVDTTDWDTSKVNTMALMFQECSSLESLDASAWNTGNVETMQQMFYNCANLQSVNTTGWDTGKVTAMVSMFRECPKLTVVEGMENWDVSKVTSFEAMFYHKSNYNTAFTGPLDLSAWNPASVENMNYMFSGLQNLAGLNASGWDMPALKQCYALLFNCYNIADVDLSNWNVPALESVGMMFANCLYKLSEIDLSTWTNVNSINYLYAAFSNAQKVTSIKIPNWTVVARGEKISLYSVFNQCSALEELDMSGWTVGGYVDDGSEVWYSLGAFQNDPNLKKLDLSNWTIAEGTSPDFFQYGSDSNQGAIWKDRTGTPPNWSTVEIVADGWNLNNVALDLSYLFSGTGIKSLSGWTNIGGVTDMSNMFSGCTSLTDVDLSGEAAALANVQQMFNGCSSLTSANLTWTGITADETNFNTTDMFKGCTKLLKDSLKVAGDAYGAAIRKALTGTSGISQQPESSEENQENDIANVPAQDVPLTDLEPVDDDASQSSNDVVDNGIDSSVDDIPVDNTVENPAYGLNADTRAAVIARADVATSTAGRLPENEVAPGDTITYKLTIKYVGDTGAKSGVISVTDSLPNGVTPVDGTIKISAVRYSNDATTGYKGGKVISTAFNGTEFTAQVDGLYAGTELDISFECTLSAVTPVNEPDGNYQYWDNTARFVQPEGPLTGDSNTLRLWYRDANTGGGGGGTTRYTITAEAENGGSISPSGAVRVSRGNDQTFRITASDGYEIADVLVDGESVGAVGSYIFENVRANHTIHVSFAASEEVPVADPDDTGVSGWLNIDDHISYLNGYADGTFRPDHNMTRAEVAQMFYNLLLDKDIVVTAAFSDVPADAWYSEAVKTLATLGMINGVGENRFEPDRAITRAEFTAIAMRFAHLPENGKNIFSDVTTSDWFYDVVVGSIQYGWINGYSDGTFRPHNTISRAEVTTITNRMLGRSADRAFVAEHLDELRTFSDVSISHWSYYAVVEATNAHDFVKNDSMENWTQLG